MEKPLPEENNHISVDALPIIIPPTALDVEPLSVPEEVSVPYVSFEEKRFKGILIGPIAPNNRSLPFLMTRTQRLSEIVVGASFGGAITSEPSVRSIFKSYGEIHEQVTQAVQDGTLQLSADDPNKNTAARIHSFIADEVASHLQPAHEAFDSFATAREAHALHPQEYHPEAESKLRHTEEKLRDTQEKLQIAIHNNIAAHHALAASGVSPEVLANYDRITGIETAIEAERQLIKDETDSGKLQIIVNFALWSLSKVGVRSGRTGPTSTFKKK